jgi:hypothetical protein
MSGSGSAQQFGTAHHTEPSVGAWSDDDSPNVNQMGAAHPVHQGVSDVAPYSAKTADSVSVTTSWRTHRNGASLPQPYTKRNAGSVYNFDS